MVCFAFLSSVVLKIRWPLQLEGQKSKLLRQVRVPVDLDLCRCEYCFAKFEFLNERATSMNKKLSVTMFAVLGILGIWLLEAQAAPPVDPSTAASISGTVKLDGTPPKPSKIDMSQDPACKGVNTVETYVVDGGNMANVFVYVKDGLSGTFDAPKDAVTIAQQGCKYHPHVLGVMVGQNIEVKNDDPTTHNIHPTPQDNREWNMTQPPNGAPIEKSFAREEIMLPVKCN